MQVHPRWNDLRFWREVVREANRFTKNAKRHRVYRAMRKADLHAKDTP